MRPFFAVCFLFALLIVPEAWAKPKETVTVQYYDIEGSRKKDLIKEMKKKGVKEKNGRFHAHTNWRVNWNYRYAPASDGCRIHSVTTDLVIHYVFPRWTPPEGVSPDLVRKWESYYSALKTHEDGHAEIGRKAALAVEAALPRLGKGLSCGQIQGAVDAEGERILNQYREEEADYDALTRSGRTQGAYLD